MMKKVLVVFALEGRIRSVEAQASISPSRIPSHPVSIASIGDAEAYVALAGVGAARLERIK